MVKEIKSLKVKQHNGAIKDCVITLSEESPRGFLFSGIELKSQEFTREDLFEALCALREELEQIGAQALCGGARLEVFPSGMSREMSYGRKAYATRLGAPALKTDLLDIFDYSPPESVCSVSQQKAFHEKWTRSLNRL